MSSSGSTISIGQEHSSTYRADPFKILAGLNRGCAVSGHAYSKRLSCSLVPSEPSLLANTLHVSSTR